MSIFYNAVAFLGFLAGVAVIIGVNIGDCITTYLVSRIGDLAVNINEEVNSLRQTGREFSPNGMAVYILEGEKPEIFGQEHSYLHDLHRSNNENYLAAYESDREKYFSKLADIPVTDVLTGPDDVDVDSDSDDGAASQDNKKPAAATS